MAQVIECVPSKHKAQRSNPSTACQGHHRGEKFQGVCQSWHDPRQWSELFTSKQKGPRKLLKRKIKKAMLEHCNNPSGKLPRGRERGKGGERTALNKAMI
jgi:hypothetical protein